MSHPDLVSLLPPRLGEVFSLLVRGRHVSAADEDAYYDLQKHFEAYRAIFAKLSYPLEQDPRGFYYVNRPGSAADLVNQIAVFVWVLVDWMGDKGRAISSEITLVQFEWGELPHLKTDRYRAYMERVGIEDEERLRAMIKKMDTQFGFIRPMSSDYSAFKFLAPVHRILDAAVAVRAKAAANAADGMRPSTETEAP